LTSALEGGECLASRPGPKPNPRTSIVHPLASPFAIPTELPRQDIKLRFTVS